jgi:hypothetical protein
MRNRQRRFSRQVLPFIAVILIGAILPFGLFAQGLISRKLLTDSKPESYEATVEYYEFQGTTPLVSMANRTMGEWANQELAGVRAGLQEVLELSHSERPDNPWYHNVKCGVVYVNIGHLISIRCER